MLQSLPHQRVALAGDWHGNSAYARRTFAYAAERGAQGLIQLGDFGVWPNGEQFLKDVNRAARMHEMWFAFIDGNHDDHWRILRTPIDSTGVRIIAGEILHIPRGFRWQWGPTRWVGLGGAVSLDRPFRTVGVSYWPEETITPEQRQRTIDGGPADVLLTHDVGACVTVPGLPPEDSWPPEEMAAANAHRRVLDGIAEVVRPRHWFHGHMHVSHQQDVIIGHRRCKVRGLDCDGSPMKKHVTIVDGVTLRTLA